MVLRRCYLGIDVATYIAGVDRQRILTGQTEMWQGLPQQLEAYKRQVRAPTCYLVSDTTVQPFRAIQIQGIHRTSQMCTDKIRHTLFK